MNLTSAKMGRGRFAFIYFGMLGLKILAVFAFFIVAAIIYVRSDNYFIVPNIFAGGVWIILDLCMLPAYAGRLNDVNISLYCLPLLYVSGIYMPALLYFVHSIAGDSPDAIMHALFQPVILAIMLFSGLAWFVSLVLFVYLFFKKGENYGMV